ncbi:hypothetical protein CXF68_09690 [Tenacibaculum sp. Bg11-29]|uniref:hypothetical protein n=1 Tax=Tenacibaculum sp. Bg11-29 TaxID=2058306 RepID=UPI000C31E37A|nr:hypothetical protein [Tenacibaculum sp. Bg11-29]PKH50938.1 hypothetical protein CXF68_09690 [Tenacibaculum sp. Bg11-29]
MYQYIYPVVGNNIKTELKLRFAIVQYTNLTQEKTNWINDLSIEFKSFFEDKNYGEDLKELYFGLTMVKPEFEQFFKKKRPAYKAGERTSYVDGIEIKSNNCAEISCKLEFNDVTKLEYAELIEKVCGKLIAESESLIRLSKLKKFDFKLFKSDFENYMLEKQYLKK